MIDEIKELKEKIKQLKETNATVRKPQTELRQEQAQTAKSIAVKVTLPAKKPFYADIVSGEPKQASEKEKKP